MFHFYMWDEENRKLAIREWRIHIERVNLVRRLGNLDLVARKWDVGDPEEFQSGGPYTERLNVEEAAITISEGRWYEIGGLDEITTLEELGGAYCEACEHDWGGCNMLLTVEAHEALEQEERRKALESAASQLAHTLGVQVDSMEFIDGVHEALRRVQDDQDQWNNPEVRMEEWAACRYAGVGSDVYFDDLNYVNGQYSSQSGHLRDILDWLETNCPLLMAKWRERQLETADAEDE